MAANNPKFDIYEGTLIVGDAIDVQEMGIHPEDVYDLGLLLLGEYDSVCETVKYDPLDCDRWDKNDYRSYARWLNSVIEVADAEATPPTDAVYQRAYYLGIGPEPRRITRRFGPLWQFHDELGFGGGYCRGKYEDWSKRDFVNYGRQVVKSSGGKKPTETILQEWFAQRLGPSPALIRNRFRGIGQFQELLGFPFIVNWTEDDYIDYGVKVALANPGIKLTRDVFDELSRKKRGPSTRTIVNHFDQLSKFKDRIEQEAQLTLAAKQAERKSKIQSRCQMVEDGYIPEGMLKWLESGDEDKFMRLTSAYILVEAIIGNSATESQKMELAKISSANLIGSIQRKAGQISAGEIEVKAAQLGVFDDLWPMDNYLKDLKISREQ